MLKKSLILATLGLTFTFISYNTFANEIPSSLATDNRMRIVEYNSHDVVTIIGNHLIATDIMFDPNEHIITYMTGDLIAWQINKDTPFMLSIKPNLPSSDTNLTVVTDKRIYHFHLLTRPSDMPQSRNVTYSLVFKYPDEEKAKFTQELDTVSQTFIGSNLTQPISWNYNYSFTGSKAIAPIKAVDNGTFTIFEFRDQSVIPAIFAVDSQQNESLLNYHVQGNYVFVQGIRHQYTFRNGNDVTTIYNDSFPIS